MHCGKPHNKSLIFSCRHCNRYVCNINNRTAKQLRSQSQWFCLTENLPVLGAAGIEGFESQSWPLMFNFHSYILEARSASDWRWFQIGCAMMMCKCASVHSNWCNMARQTTRRHTSDYADRTLVQSLRGCALFPRLTKDFVHRWYHRRTISTKEGRGRGEVPPEFPPESSKMRGPSPLSSWVPSWVPLSPSLSPLSSPWVPWVPHLARSVLFL